MSKQATRTKAPKNEPSTGEPTGWPEVSEDELMARALRAYWIAARKAGTDADIPSNWHSGRSRVEEVSDKRYAVLRNGGGVLAVYRVRNDGMLKRLRRWPSEL